MMGNPTRLVRRRWLAGVAGAAALVVGAPLMLSPASAAPSTSSVSRIARYGLTTPPVSGANPARVNNGQNTYAWSMAWFNGKLYVGTGAHELCVEHAIGDYYFPGQNKYKTVPARSVYCPADKFDLKLQAQVWAYTPGTKKWKLVYQAPNIPINNADLPAADQNKGKVVGRDVGYRAMVVLDGVLYISGVTADEYMPNTRPGNPPRILYTTDGTTFHQINGYLPSVTNPSPYGVQQTVTWRGLTSFNGHLYGVEGASFTGDGQLVRIDNPTSSTPTLTQVTPVSGGFGTLDVYEMAEYNGDLYIGTADRTNGYGVYRTDGTNDTTWIPVVVNGAGRGNVVNSVVSMGVYKGDLYVGASGWYASTLPQSEMIRIHSNNTFDLITGDPRPYAFVNLAPLSGLGNGFGNIFTAHFWRFGSVAGGFYITTNDWSANLWNVPGVNAAVKKNYGFDLWGTCDGEHWSAVTQNAFGDGLYNFGGRTTTTDPNNPVMYIGSVNAAQGFSVWKTGNMMGCAAN
jgi:hypothetical protein